MEGRVISIKIRGGAHSSMVEHVAHNDAVVGSNPAEPKRYLLTPPTLYEEPPYPLTPKGVASITSIEVQEAIILSQCWKKEK